ncbi:MAG: glucokinase [Pseudomonadota bacterium]
MAAPVLYDLVGDIGGTNARFAITAPGGELGSVVRPRMYEHRQFKDVSEALAAYLREEGLTAPPRHVALAVAGPIDNQTIAFTNSDWRFSAETARAAVGAQAALLINDYAALARALPLLAEADLTPLTAGGAAGARADPSAPKVVLGPGTGLGLAAWVPPQGAVVTTEGGHAAFAPLDEAEWAIARFAAAQFGRASYERLVSGAGLVTLYQAVADARGEAAEDIQPADVTERALAGDDALCVAALTHFCAILGAFAGDAALIYGAKGGVYLAGGISPKLGPFLLDGPFLQRFQAKGRYKDYVSRIPVWRIDDPFAALRGAAAYAADMTRA